MTSQTPDMQPILERLDRLERQNRRLKRVGLLALIAVGVVVLMGQAAPKNRTVEANEFILKDEAGNVKARLHMDHGPRLSFYDASGLEKCTLMQGINGGSLFMKSNPSARFPELQLFVTPDGSTLHLMSPQKGMVTLTSTSPGPQLTVWDAEGYHADIGVSGIEFPQTGGKQTTSAASIILFGKDGQGKVIWRAP